MPENIFSQSLDSTADEIFEVLLETAHFKLERIISSGQAKLPGEWLEEETREWVILLSGSATLLFEGDSGGNRLGPGDYVYIPAHQKHRVESTDVKQKTVWLALHYR